MFGAFIGAMTRFCNKYTNLSFVQGPQYTLEYIMAKEEHPDKKYSGSISHQS